MSPSTWCPLRASAAGRGDSCSARAITRRAARAPVRRARQAGRGAAAGWGGTWQMGLDQHERHSKRRQKKCKTNRFKTSQARRTGDENPQECEFHWYNMYTIRCDAIRPQIGPFKLCRARKQYPEAGADLQGGGKEKRESPRKITSYDRQNSEIAS